MVQNHKPVARADRSRVAELRAERQAAAANPSHWTQASLARVVGASLRSVKSWEAGHAVPRPYYRRRLAAALGVSVSDLGFRE
jgi:DNA-binding XRE family transcriptional regulator